MTTIASELQAIRERIHRAANQYGRRADTIHLIAVSKTQAASRVHEAVLAGQHAFGENFVQEGIDKIKQLADNNLEWHFIGALQSNKTRQVSENFAWVHSLERLKIAERLAHDRPTDLAPLNICLQVNISNENSKSGVLPENLLELAQQVAKLPTLRLRGLMCIPRPSEDFQEQRTAFRALRHLYETLQQHGLALDTLSMGMSQDLEAAIAEGATHIRVGTAIFGARNAHGTQ